MGESGHTRFSTGLQSKTEGKQKRLKAKVTHRDLERVLLTLREACTQDQKSESHKVSIKS